MEWKTETLEQTLARMKAMFDYKDRELEEQLQRDAAAKSVAILMAATFKFPTENKIDNSTNEASTND